ncbi:dynein regulatory complex protein 12 [Antennarius striatus]|uniref:dynein regulatory complex protein 12 n=1 Tax=Antennarius striatus TaxID=241820 RepID=UPI0035AF8743
MAPRKKSKKATKKNPEKSENDLEAKYRRSILDVALLQDQIALQGECVLKIQSDRTDLKRHMRNMEQNLQYEIQDHRDINSDLSRMYKTMHSDLTNKVTSLEKEVSHLQEELVLCQEELKRVKREHEEVKQEKDGIISDLQCKLDNMEIDHEKILHETLNGLTSQLSVVRQGWEVKSTSLHQKYKERLAEFGLNALDI